jgi:DNA invertase Pin-like site-specific DNA recombinase
MEIALYVRVSTTRQPHTQTIEQQLARLRAAVAMHPDWHLAEEHIYRDDGVEVHRADCCSIAD